jgi:hypothetical protein
VFFYFLIFSAKRKLIFDILGRSSLCHIVSFIRLLSLCREYLVVIIIIIIICGQNRNIRGFTVFNVDVKRRNSLYSTCDWAANATSRDSSAFTGMSVVLNDMLN